MPRVSHHHQHRGLLLAAELDAHLTPERVQRALTGGRLQRSELDEQPVSLGSQIA